MKTSRYMAEAVFLLTVFYGVKSSSYLNEARKPQVVIHPEGKTLTIPSEETFQLFCYGFDLNDSVRMVWINPKGNVIREGLDYRYLTRVSRFSNSIYLLFPLPMRVHSGNYTCSAEYYSTFGDLQKLEASVNLTVLDKPKISRFKNISVEVGSRAVLECKAQSDPIPNVTIWKENDPNWAENEDARIEVTSLAQFGDTNEVTVTIHAVNRSDEGNYYCAAEANGYNRNTTAYLEVQFSPNLTATPRTQLISGNVTNLTCIAEANPPANITWEFENEKIDPEKQQNVTYGRTVISHLVIAINDTSDVHSNVFGTYKCTASNRLGSRSVNITLQEADVPGEINEVVVDRITPRSLFFRFVGPFYDGGERVMSYVANYSKFQDSNYSVIEWPIGSPYAVWNLTPEANYVFKVAAKNAVGIGAWKTVQYVMPKEINDTITEPNTLITQNVNITDYPDRYEIRWKVHDDYGELKRYFVVTYFDDGRVKVEHQNGNTTFPIRQEKKSI